MGEEFVWAVKNGDLEKVKAIVGASEEKLITEEINGRTPITYAADFGQKEVIEYLLAEGADVNGVTREVLSPPWCQTEEMVQAYTATCVDKHGITPLLAAIWEGHTKCVEVILAKGANKDLKAPDGSSYLESATKDEIKALLR